MGGPPTLLSRAHAALRVLFPILLAVVLFGTDLRYALNIPPDWLGWIYFGLVVAFYAAPGMLEYPVTTFGKARSVDTRPLENPDDRRCTVCGSEIATGEHRRYKEQWVLFGAPIRNVDWGENDYCELCVDREKRGVASDGPMTVADVKSEGPLPGELGEGSRADGERVREREPE